MGFRFMKNPVRKSGQPIILLNVMGWWSHDPAGPRGLAGISRTSSTSLMACWRSLFARPALSETQSIRIPLFPLEVRRFRFQIDMEKIKRLTDGGSMLHHVLHHHSRGQNHGSRTDALHERGGHRFVPITLRRVASFWSRVLTNCDVARWKSEFSLHRS